MSINSDQGNSWSLPRPADISKLQSIDLPEELKYLLVRRGIKTKEDIISFIHPSEPPDPLIHFSQLNKAIEILKEYIDSDNEIAICGDYDADGMTSTALLINSLTKIGIKCFYEIPNRVSEGYGLNLAMIEKINSKGIKLVITVDNGVSANDAIKLGHSYGIKFIITDHHLIPENFPEVFSLIHPLRTPKSSPYQSLAGVGLAYLLAFNLAKSLSYDISELSILELFCIGTIADMASLVGVNRALIKLAFSSLENSKCEGIKALKKISGLEGSKLTSEDIGYKIAPRINAVGRIGNPSLIVKLLTESNTRKAEDYAKECNKLNEERKELTKQILFEAMTIIDSDKKQQPNFILIAQPHWHSGVIGLASGRLKDKFDKPVAVLTSDNNGNFRGSIRAPENINIIKLLDKCSELLISYGGHKSAAGFTAKATNLSLLHERLIDETNKQILAIPLNKTIKPEVLLDLDKIDKDFWLHYQKLEPFGIGNPTPLFWAYNCKVVWYKFDNNKTLRLTISNGLRRIQCIYWNCPFDRLLFTKIDIAFSLSSNNWKGKFSIVLSLKALKESSEQINLKFHNRNYICFVKDSDLIIINSDHKKLIIPINESSINDYLSKNKGVIHPYIYNLIVNTSIATGLSF